VTYFVLPNRPESTTYLTNREREVAMERMNRDQTGDVGLLVRKDHIKLALVDWRASWIQDHKSS